METLVAQQNLRLASAMAFAAAARQSAEEIRRLGARFCENAWHLPVLGDTFDIDVQGGCIVTADGGRVGPHWSILALHYLAVTSRPERCMPEITFADFATARSYAKVYHQRVVARLCATAGRDAARLRAAAESLDGRAVAVGDLGFDFPVFPRFTMRLVWHSPDEEFPPAATLLLPANAESFFCAEDLVVLSECLVARLAGRPF